MFSGGFIIRKDATIAKTEGKQRRRITGIRKIVCIHCSAGSCAGAHFAARIHQGNLLYTIFEKCFIKRNIHLQKILSIPFYFFPLKLFWNFENLKNLEIKIPQKWRTKCRKTILTKNFNPSRLRAKLINQPRTISMSLCNVHKYSYDIL